MNLIMKKRLKLFGVTYSTASNNYFVTKSSFSEVYHFAKIVFICNGLDLNLDYGICGSLEVAVG